MCCRYALILGRGAHRHRLRRMALEACLEIRLDQPALLLAADARTPTGSFGNAALVGRMFARGEDFAAVIDAGSAFSDEAAALADASGIRTHWGSFALFHANASQPDWIYRDPSGAIPVYHHRLKDGDVFVSDAELANRLGLIDRDPVDPTFVRHWLRYPFLRTARTGLSGFTEILPGTCVSRRSGEWRDVPFWRPSRFGTRSHSVADPGEAAQMLREAMIAAARQQLSGPVLLQLSGGLDSSILAASLLKAQVPFICVNFATRSADGNERRYAGAVARSVGAPLVELEEIETEALIGPNRRLFRPGTNPLLAPVEQAIDQYAADAGVEAIVDGGGGDNLFCHTNSAAPLVDALFCAGARTAAVTVDAIASRAGCSSWRVIRSAIMRLAQWPGARPWRADNSFLTREMLLGSSEEHPWFEGCRFLPPGKQEHLEAMVHVQHFLDRSLGSDHAHVHPLFAQPLIELCLRIPSWLWTRNGRDRAVARDAFHGLLPEMVLARRTKGSLQGMFHRGFERLSGEARTLLCDGELRRLGIIDADAMAQAFHARTKDPLVQMRLTELAAMELWLTSWRR